MTQMMDPVIDCSKAKGLLSDLLDVRRGEWPAPMDSPLGTPEVQSAVEKHVAACEECSRSLHELEELGLAFSEGVLKDPGEAHFTQYGRMVRERVRRMTQRTTAQLQPRTVSQWKTWLSTVAASAAAAVLTVVLLNPGTTETKPGTEVIGKAPATPTVRNEMKGNTPSEPSKTVKVAESSIPRSVLHASKASLRPDLATLELRSVPVQIWTPEGAKLLNMVPKADNTYPVADLRKRYGQIVLGEGPSTALVGIAFKADSDVVPEGLCVVAVKRGGVADAIGIRPDDRLLALNGITFSNSSPEEILKFFNAISSLGPGKLIEIDFAKKSGDDWIIKRGKSELGKFK